MNRNTSNLPAKNETKTTLSILETETSEAKSEAGISKEDRVRDKTLPGRRYLVGFRGTRNEEWIEAESSHKAKQAFAAKNGLTSLTYIRCRGSIPTRSWHLSSI